MNLKIKKATKKDLLEIGKLMNEEFSKPPFNERESIKSILKSLNFYYKIGEIYNAKENGIAGVIIFKIEQWWEGPVIIIEDLAVKQEFKKNKIEKRLIEFIESYGKNKKVKSITFTTNKKDKGTKIYQKLGYKKEKEIVSFSKRLK